MYSIFNDLRSSPQRDLLSILSMPEILNPAHTHPEALAAIDHEQIQRTLDYFSDSSQAAHFDRAMADPARRLGHYVEDLLIYWLEHIIQTEHYERIQINVAKRSVGEFDLLFKMDGGWHWWEICMKFYCLHQEPDTLTQWIGPNSQDNLGRKYEHLFNQQLQLLDHQEARDVLTQHQITTPKRAALFKGYLFKQPEQQLTSMHPAINPTSHLYWYVYQRACSSIPCERAASRFTLVPRREWIAPVLRSPRSHDLFSHRHMIDQIKQHPPPGPRMLAELVPDSNGWWQEVNRGFVMPDQWPESKT